METLFIYDWGQGVRRRVVGGVGALSCAAVLLLTACSREHPTGYSGLALLVAVTMVVITVLAVTYRPLLFATADPEVAAARGAPVTISSVNYPVCWAIGRRHHDPAAA
jgi:mannose/fructose/N-acetylgalactosamine-specific phosphotransferase system component IIC